jgi:hypothetical protein
VAAAFTSNMLPLCKNTRCHKYKNLSFTDSIGDKPGNIIFILLNPALFAYFNSIEIDNGKDNCNSNS